MIFKRILVILKWGSLLFVFNYIVLYLLILTLGPTLASMIMLPIEFTSIIIANYKGVLAYSRIGEKEKNSLLNNIFLLLFIGWIIAGIPHFFFGVASFIFSGEFDFGGPGLTPGILIGAIGGLLAKQKLQGKPVKLFGIEITK